MRMTVKFLIAGSMMTLLLAGCGNDSRIEAGSETDCEPSYSFQTVKPGQLTVGTANQPPQNILDGSGNTSGIDSDVIRGFAESICIPIDFVTGDTANMITSVQQGRNDTSLGGWYRTNTRKEIVDMSEPMYLDGLSIASAQGVNTIAGLEALNSVGTVDGYAYADDLQKVLGDKLKLYPSSLNMKQDLEIGRIDAAVDGLIGSSYVYSEVSDIQVQPAEKDPRVAASLVQYQSSLPIKKGNDDFAQALDDYIVQIKADGTMAEILQKYGVDPSLADTGAPNWED